MMRRVALLAGIALVAAAAVSITGYFVDAIPPDPGGPDEVSTEPTALGPFELTDQEVSQARQIMVADDRFLALLGDVPYRVVSVGPWHTSDLQLIGAGLILALDQPASFELTDWPQIEGIAKRFGATGVTEFEVMVDFTKSMVVSIQPSEFEAAQPPPDFTPEYNPSD